MVPKKELLGGIMVQFQENINELKLFGYEIKQYDSGMIKFTLKL